MAKPRKLPMAKRETVEQRSTSFSKRRYGLFNKAAELALLCDAQLAVFVSSPSSKSKFYSFANPSVDVVLEAFLQNQRLVGGDNNINAESAFSVFSEIKKLESLLKDLQNKKGKGTLDEDFEHFQCSQSVDELNALLKELEKLTQKGIRKMGLQC